MSEIQNEKDLERIMERVVSRVLPSVIRNSNNSVRVGSITRVDTIGNRIDALILNTNENVTNVKYQSGATNVNLNNNCIILSPDPRNQNLIYAIVF